MQTVLAVVAVAVTLGVVAWVAYLTGVWLTSALCPPLHPVFVPLVGSALWCLLGGASGFGLGVLRRRV